MCKTKRSPSALYQREAVSLFPLEGGVRDTTEMMRICASKLSRLRSRLGRAERPPTLRTSQQQPVVQCGCFTSHDRHFGAASNPPSAFSADVPFFPFFVSRDTEPRSVAPRRHLLVSKEMGVYVNQNRLFLFFLCADQGIDFAASLRNSCATAWSLRL